METNTPELSVTAIANMATAALQTRTVHDVPMVVVPPGHKLENLEHLLPQPRRIKQSVAIATAQSFIDYYQLFATDNTLIFASEASGTFKAVFDYHAPDEPDNCDHHATLVLKKSQEWQAWLNKNTQPMKQRDFAEFIENNIADIREPAGAKMLEIAKTLQATKNIKFRSSTELHNGQTQLTYNEEINGQAGNTGEMEIPPQITIGCRVFKGQDAYAVTARFRYRLTDDGGLLFSYHINDLDRIEEDAFQMVFTQLKANCRAASYIMS